MHDHLAAHQVVRHAPAAGAVNLRGDAVAEAGGEGAHVAAVDDVDRLEDRDAEIVPRLRIEKLDLGHAVICGAADLLVDRACRPPGAVDGQ